MTEEQRKTLLRVGFEMGDVRAKDFMAGAEAAFGLLASSAQAGSALATERTTSVEAPSRKSRSDERQTQIEAAALKHAIKEDEAGFIEGAEWADNNPAPATESLQDDVAKYVETLKEAKAFQRSQHQVIKELQAEVERVKAEALEASEHYHDDLIQRAVDEAVKVERDRCVKILWEGKAPYSETFAIVQAILSEGVSPETDAARLGEE